jgi:diacylglycerol kinase (ATP)
MSGGFVNARGLFSWNNEGIRQDCFMISVANGRRYGGGFKVAPRAILDDGLLDVSIIGKVSLLGRLRHIPAMEKGRHLHLPFVHYAQLPLFRVEFSHPVAAHLDGELLEASLFETTVLPERFSFLF